LIRNKYAHLNYWQQGELLYTKDTAKLSEEDFNNADFIERCMIFKDFSYRDQGRSRIFISKSQSPEIAYKKLNFHNRIITCMWKINKLMEKYK